jgi:hypothetical protein
MKLYPNRVRVPTSPLRNALTAPKDATTVPSLMFFRASPLSRLLGLISTMSVRTLFEQLGIVHDDHPFIVLTETKFSFHCIPVGICTLLTGLGSKKTHVIMFSP